MLSQNTICSATRLIPPGNQLLIKATELGALSLEFTPLNRLFLQLRGTANLVAYILIAVYTQLPVLVALCSVASVYCLGR